MFFGPQCYGCASICHFVILAISGTRPLSMRKQVCLFYLYATTNGEIHICSNKHQTGLVHITIKYHGDILKTVYGRTDSAMP